MDRVSIYNIYIGSGDAISCRQIARAQFVLIQFRNSIFKIQVNVFKSFALQVATERSSL